MLGQAQAAFDLSLDYVANKRVQFGHPIGHFQAMRHLFAEMFRDLETSRWLSYQALWRIDQGLDAALEISMAKAKINVACASIARRAHQAYGGVGYSTEADIEIYYRLSLAGQSSFGDTRYHLEKIGGFLKTEDNFRLFKLD